MQFLYELPNWLMGVSVIATAMVLSYGGYFAFHRFCRPSFTEENRSVALAVLGVVATVNSLLLAFSAISVWEAFGAAEVAVVQEANTLGALARDLAVYDSADSRQARRMLHDYANFVVKAEWPEMSTGRANPDAWRQFDQIFVVIGRIEPDTPRRVALMPEIWARVNELVKQRRSRLKTSESEVPATLWFVVLVGSAMTIASAFVLPPTRFHLWMVGFLALSFGLVFYLIVAMDRPFAGQESISPEPFTGVIANIERWDAEQSGSLPR